MRYKTITLFAAALLFTVVTACKPQQNNNTVPLPVVVTEQAVSGTAGSAVDVIGQVQANASVDIIARVEGFIKERNFKEGELVKAGAVLYKIEPEQYAAAVEAAEADLMRNESALKNAEIEEARQKTLFESKAGSERDYDNAKTKVLECQAMVKAAEAQLKVAKLNLSYTDVVAPFDGRVGLTNFYVGDLVSPAKGKLTSIVAVSPVRVRFKLPESLLLRFTDARIGKGEVQNEAMPVVRIQLENGQFYPLNGKIAYWDNNVSSTTATIEVQALFDNPDNFLVPGMNVRVYLESAKQSEVVLVPRLAVQEDQQGKYVYIVNKDNVTERRQVECGNETGGKIVIYSGVSVGESVVIDGFQRIRNKIKVDAVTAEQRAKEQAERIAAIAGTADGKAETAKTE